jgi:hypothetical protein
MHHRWDNRDHSCDEHRLSRETEDSVFTTLAVGEEGDPDLDPEPVGPPEAAPIYTTMAVGEEGDPELLAEPAHPPEALYTTMAVGEEDDPDHLPDEIGFPEEPVFTLLAFGEGGGGEVEPGWPAFINIFATGEDGDGGFEDIWCA